MSKANHQAIEAIAEAQRAIQYASNNPQQAELQFTAAQQHLQAAMSATDDDGIQHQIHSAQTILEQAKAQAQAEAFDQSIMIFDQVNEQLEVLKQNISEQK